MPSSQQTTVFALPAGKDRTELTRATRSAIDDSVKSDRRQTPISSRARPPLVFIPAEQTPPVSAPPIEQIQPILITPPTTPHDQIHVQTVLVGLLVTFVTWVAFSLLGVAIGVTILEPFGDTVTTNVSYYAPRGVLWGVGSFLLALFFSGFVAVRTNGIWRKETAWLSGMMIFFSCFVLFIILAGMSIALILNTLGTNPVDLYLFGYSAINDPGVPGALMDGLKPFLWGGIASLLAGSLASGLGGLAGRRKDKDSRAYRYEGNR